MMMDDDDDAGRVLLRNWSFPTLSRYYLSHCWVWKDGAVWLRALV